jgi:hypothetical protein
MSGQNMWSWTPEQIVDDMTSKIGDIRHVEIRAALLQAKIAKEVSDVQEATANALVLATDGLKEATRHLRWITLAAAGVLSAATIAAAAIATSGG